MSQQCKENKKGKKRKKLRLIHLADESVNLVFTVTQISTLNKVFKLSRAETPSWRRKLERPEEVGGLLEIGPNSIDFVDQILNGNDSVLAKNFFNQGVVGL